jgi:osmotically-inducible protein OsmY
VKVPRQPAEAAEDREIAAAILAFLRRAAPGVSVVECRRGVVTIAGVVATPTERRAVGDMVRAHDGVRRVENRLEVRAGGPVRSGPG